MAALGLCITLAPLLGRDVLGDGLIVMITIVPFIVMAAGLTVLCLWLDRTAVVWTSLFTIVPVAVMLSIAYNAFDQDAQGGVIFFVGPILIPPMIGGIGLFLGAASLSGFRQYQRERRQS